MLLASALLPLPGPDGRLAHLPPLCPFLVLTGLPCPGCGLTRAFVCLGHGRWEDAERWHPLGGLAYALCVAACLRAGLSWRLGRAVLPLSPRLTKGLTALALAVFLLVGAGRIAWLLIHHAQWG